MVQGILAFAALAACYALFAGELSVSELEAGVPAAALATALAVLLHRSRQRPFRLRAPWLRVLGRPLAALFADAVKVGLVLATAIRRRPSGPVGSVLRQPFRHGGDDPADAGRRALSILGSSFAPNGFVLRAPDRRDVLLVHCLHPAPAKPDPEWPL